MKKTKSPSFAIVLIFVFGFLILFVYLSMNNTLNKSRYRYSTSNNSGEGSRVLYLLLEDLGYNVSTYKKSSVSLKDQSFTMIAVNPEPDIFNDEKELRYLKTWLSKGNHLIFTCDRRLIYNYDFYSLTGNTIEFEKPETDVEVGKGSITLITSPDKYVNNQNVLDNFNVGVIFVRNVDRRFNMNVVFNEFYHGQGTASNELWEAVPDWGRVFLLQTLLAMILLVFYYAKRMGSPVKVAENIKRAENEKMYALSNMFSQINSMPEIAAIYKDFLSNRLALKFCLPLPASETEIVQNIKNDKILAKQGFLELYKSLLNIAGGSRVNNKKTVRIINEIEKIRKEM